KLTQPHLTCEDEDEIRLKFKDYVNRLACVKEQNGVKYLLLRNEYVDELCTMPPDVPPPPYTPARVEPDLCAAGFSRQETPCLGYSTPAIGQTPQTPQWRQFSPQENIMVANECPSLALARAPHNRSSPCLLEDVRSYEDIPPPLPKKKHSLNGSPTRPEVPLPPPRGRKSHGRRGSQVEERVRQFSAEKELEGSPNFKEKSVQDVAVSPGTVKEKTQIINRMSESNLLTKVAAGPGGGSAAKRRDGPGARAAADDDTTSLNTLDPRRREWILRAAQADYHSLVRLLREDPDLYRFETDGPTAFLGASSRRNLCRGARGVAEPSSRLGRDDGDDFLVPSARPALVSGLVGDEGGVQRPSGDRRTAAVGLPVSPPAVKTNSGTAGVPRPAAGSGMVGSSVIALGPVRGTAASLRAAPFGRGAAGRA
ncbi:hypothetical protein HPB47_000045, partial [Ixodes persulcatus]